MQFAPLDGLAGTTHVFCRLAKLLEESPEYPDQPGAIPLDSIADMKSPELAGADDIVAFITATQRETC